MTFNELVEKHELSIQRWVNEGTLMVVSDTDKKIIFEFAKVVPDVNNKIKNNSGCGTCYKACISIILKILNNTNQVSQKQVNDLDILEKNIIFKLNKAYKLDMLTIDFDGTVLTVSDKDGFKDFTDTIVDIYNPDIIQLLKYYLQVHPNMMRYFLIEEVIKEVVAEEEVVNKEIPLDVVTTIVKPKNKKKNA